MPNAIRSERESYSAPNLLVVFVTLAIFPSRPSSMQDIIMATAAFGKFPPMEAIIE